MIEEFIIFGAGMVVGLLIRSELCQLPEEKSFRVSDKIFGGKTQFLEPMSPEEKFKESETVDDFVK